MSDVSRPKSQFKITASTAIVEKRRIVLVREGRGSDRKQWNLPGGKVRAGEDIIEAAVRETLEETGYKVDVQGLAGMYCYPTSTVQRMRLVFHANIVAGKPQFDGDEILDVRWFAFNQLNKMPDKRLSKASLFRRMLKDIKSGEICSADVLEQLELERSVA